MPRILLFTLIVLSPWIAYGEIYKRVNPDGTVVFSDEPTQDAELINVKPIQTIPFPKVKTTPSQPQASQQDKNSSKYISVTITQPLHDEAIRKNNGVINVSIAVKPKLNNAVGHLIYLTLDGKDIAKPTSSTTFTLNNVDRGSHTLVATIRDKNGKIILQSAPVTFHLQRYSALNKKHPPPPVHPINPPIATPFPR